MNIFNVRINNLLSLPKTSIVIIFLTVIQLPLLFSCKESISQYNHDPIIEILTANPDTIIIGGASNLICIANDPDGDSLLYYWEYSSGILSGIDSSVIWVAPDSMGIYSVSCKVIDGYGGEDVDTVSILIEDSFCYLIQMSVDNSVYRYEYLVEPDSLRETILFLSPGHDRGIKYILVYGMNQNDRIYYYHPRSGHIRLLSSSAWLVPFMESNHTIRGIFEVLNNFVYLHLPGFTRVDEDTSTTTTLTYLENCN